MIHYHGSPITPESAAAKIYAGRHAMVSFAHPDQLPLIADVCQSFALDNGAFSAWRSGKPIDDWQPFFDWIETWKKHPAFDWFLIPDVIGGSEEDNDLLLAGFSGMAGGVPIWHMHESISRLLKLVHGGWERVAIGSSGEYAVIKSPIWWKRMDLAMESICDSEGRPPCKLHGLRMLDPDVFRHLPFASADSTNVGRNVNLDQKWTGPYPPAGKAARGIVLAERVEAYQSAAIWKHRGTQQEFSLMAEHGE